MNKELNLNNVQIVLFFKNEIEANSLELATNITKKIPELEQPSILNLPDSIPYEMRVQAPKIIFNNANDLSVSITSLNASINVMEKNTRGENIVRYVGLVYDALQECEVQIKSIGVVSEYNCFDVNFELIKNHYYKEEMLEGETANSAWYTKKDNLNIWKTLNVDEENDKKTLTIVCDVNNRDNDTIINKEKVFEIINKSKSISINFKEKIMEVLGE